MPTEFAQEHPIIEGLIPFGADMVGTAAGALLTKRLGMGIGAQLGIGLGAGYGASRWADQTPGREDVGSVAKYTGAALGGLGLLLSRGTRMGIKRQAARATRKIRLDGAQKTYDTIQEAGIRNKVPADKIHAEASNAARISRKIGPASVYHLSPVLGATTGYVAGAPIDRIIANYKLRGTANDDDRRPASDQ